MTELVITDPKFLRAFEKKFNWYGVFELRHHGDCAIVVYYLVDSISAVGFASDDEYIWVMLRAMEEGLI